MKKWMGIVSMVALLAACTDSMQNSPLAADGDSLQEGVVEADMAVVQESFPRLFSYLEQQDSTFSADSFLLSGEAELERLPPVQIDKARLKPFEKYFIYNKDSSMAIDLYSYSHVVTTRNGQSQLEMGEPDSEAALINFKDGSRRRLFYGGPSHPIWDAKWVTPTELLLIGAETHQNKFIPTIWQVRLPDTAIQVYAYQGEIKADMTGYQAETRTMGF